MIMILMRWFKELKNFKNISHLLNKNLLNNRNYLEVIYNICKCIHFRK